MARPARSSIRKSYGGPCAGYYSTPKGQMLSFRSTVHHGVLVQQGRLRESRAQSQQPPATWQGVVAAARSSRLPAPPPVRSQRLAILDAARELLGGHNQPFATEQNASRATIRSWSSTARSRRDIANMQEWVKKGYFVYGGRKERARGEVLCRRVGDDDDVVRRLRNDQAECEVKFGVAPLPYYNDVQGAPQTRSSRRVAG